MKVWAVSTLLIESYIISWNMIGPCFNPRFWLDFDAEVGDPAQTCRLFQIGLCDKLAYFPGDKDVSNAWVTALELCTSHSDIIAVSEKTHFYSHTRQRTCPTSFHDGTQLDECLTWWDVPLFIWISRQRIATTSLLGQSWIRELTRAKSLGLISIQWAKARSSI